MMSTLHPTVGSAMGRIKDGYEELINSIVEKLTS